MKQYKIKYRNYILGAIITTSLVLLSSCEKKIFEEPYANLDPNDAFSTADRIERASVGMYDQLQNLEFLGGRVLIYADIRSNDVNIPSFFGNMAQFNNTSSDLTTQNVWQAGYRTIYEANYFMQKLQENSSKTSAEKQKQYVGEAKFIRALCNFYLVNLFAQPYKFTAGATHLGIPIITKAVAAADAFDPSNKVARNTVAEVYAAMEADLLDAESKLLDNYGEPKFSDVARATKAAAQGLLMRIYLYKGDNTAAVTYADKIINGGRYALNASPEIAFRTYAGGENHESIFSVAHNSVDNPNTNNALGQHYSPELRGDISVSEDYLNLPGFSTTDKRYTLLILDAYGDYWTTKYQTTSDWVPVLRYAEVLLTKAEALAKLNTAAPDLEALDLINQIRTRSAATPYLLTDITSAADLVEKVLNERKIELAFEGQGEFDFLRNGKAIPAHGTVKEQPYGSNYVILPIPKKDTDANPNLVQNPGY